MIEFTEEELNALYRFFDRGVSGDLSPMEVVQVCVRGQLLIRTYAAKDGKTLYFEEDENAASYR